MAETLTLADAKISVARTIGGQNDADQIAAAGDAITFALNEMNWRHNWRFLLMDNDQTIQTTASVDSSSTTLTAGTDQFKNFYVGNRIWDYGGDPDTDGTYLYAGTTITDKSDNATITVSQAPASVMTDQQVESDGRIAMISGQSVYRLPHPMKRPYTARLISKNRSLQYEEMRRIDSISRTIETTGETTHYTMYGDVTQAAQGFSAASLDDRAGWIKLYRTPNYSASNELLVRYYRPINVAATTIDLPERYIYPMLILAKYYYLVDKDAESARTQEHKQRSEMALRQAIADDVGIEDREVALVAQMRYGQSRGAIDVPVDPWYD
jgi:hypothetical protein